MAIYYRYCVQVTDNGQRVRVEVRSQDNETLNELIGSCNLASIPPSITRLAIKVRQGKASATEMAMLGEDLFQSLFPAELMTHFRDFLAQLSNTNSFIRLELDLDEVALPAIAALPWELLRAPQAANWAVDNLGTHPQVVLSRKRALWRAAASRVFERPLCIQLVVAQPKNPNDAKHGPQLGPVLYDRVVSTLQQLAQVSPDRIAPLPEVLHQPDLIKIERVLESRRPDILHFIGHGRLRKLRGRQFGQLALVDAAGYADWVSDTHFAELFQTYAPAIVVFQACESGLAGDTEALVGVASQTVQRNVPVVVAMQYPIRNVVAGAFANEFYSRVAQLEAVDLAVQKGRRMLRQRFRETRDFAAPVLFMRVANGQLFVQPSPDGSQSYQADTPSIPQLAGKMRPEALPTRDAVFLLGQLEQHKRNLKILLREKSTYGSGECPLYLLNQIQAEEAMIEQIKQQIR